MLKAGVKGLRSEIPLFFQLTTRFFKGSTNLVVEDYPYRAVPIVALLPASSSILHAQPERQNEDYPDRNSSRNDLKSDQTMTTIMRAKGKAARIDPVCRPFKPPDQSKIEAATD